MGCKQLPYYHRFLGKEKSFPSLKVVYNKQEEGEIGYRQNYQWDYIHNPQTMLFAWLKSEKEGELTWTLVDRLHTLLFNHVYDNNHIGSMTYLATIQKAIISGNNDTIGLSYTADESDNWSKEEKAWIDQWKMRAINSDDVFNDVIKSIKDAGKDEKIAKIVLRPKHIYIGKYKYDGVEYPVAIYGNGDKTVMTDAFTKIQVTDADKLEDRENKKHIYCDETFTKYLIIAFYEDGKTEPSMIMQVEKFVGDDTKDKWLEYLGILVKETKPPVVSDTIKIFITRTNTGTNSTTGILKTDDENYNRLYSRITER